MTQERYTGQSFPSPEKWSGHHFEDNCPTIDMSNMSLFIAGAEHIANMPLLVNAGRLINQYLSNPNHVPIRTFNYGEAFDADIYPHGTIVRYELEEISYKLGQELKKSKNIFWGVVMLSPAKEEIETSIISYKQEDIIRNRINPLNGIRLDPLINVGITEHLRKSAKGNITFQSLERVDWLQRMSLGMGISIAMPHKARVVFHHQPVAA